MNRRVGNRHGRDVEISLEISSRVRNLFALSCIL